MKRTIWWTLFAIGIVLVGAIAYYAIPRLEPVPQPRQMPPEPATAAPPAAPQAAPEIRYPIPQVQTTKPLPALDTSDSTMKGEIERLWNDKAVEERFHLKDFIRRVVVTIDNLPRAKLPLQYMPLKRVAGAFAVTGEGESLVVSAENAARYEPYLRLLDAVDTPKLVALYVRLYPLFQQAYADIGYPDGYFNDRLIQVVDDLLAAPELQPPVMLVRPKVYYQYADPGLESRSAGQKMLMRMGRNNEMRVKARLAEIRAALISQASLNTASQ